jgi:glycosyl transferase family 2
VAMTIGMATYDDFDGVYFTIQGLRLYQDLTDTEILVVDNHGCDATQKFVESVPNARYIRATRTIGTAVRDLVFSQAKGDAVLCVDSHILFVPGAVARLRQYYADHPQTRDLLQGPLLYDDLTSISTHFEPEWRSQMWGTWSTDPRGIDAEGEAFDIPSQGLGVFSCRRQAWPGFNPAFRGFGGEEGYIHEKFRQRGDRTLCLPWLRWVHRFGRPKGVPYPLTVEMKLRNYIIGFTELGLDTKEAEAHFAEFLSPKRIAKVKRKALHDYAKHNLPAQTRVAVLGDEGQANGQRVPFARDDQRPGETTDEHLARLRRQVAATMAEGSTHLLIPRAEADWIGDQPHVEEYLSQEHEFVDAGQEFGLVFALRDPVERESHSR